MTILWNRQNFFARKGCERIHIVDLDGAFGRKDINKETILKIREGVQIQIELGGGIKDGDDISFWLKEGIDFLIIGSLAAKKQDYIFNISKKFKEKNLCCFRYFRLQNND